jgi:PAP_fibrillin
MKNCSILARAARASFISAALCACSIAPGDNRDTENAASAEETSQAALSGSASEARSGFGSRARRIEVLKGRIVAIAKANQLRTDNFAEVTAELRPLVERLVKLAPTRTQAEALAMVQGPWLSLWSNLGFGRATPNLERIYQVVRAGYYYNISEFTAPSGELSVGALRGAYAPIPNSLAIRFTRNGFLPGSLAFKSGAEIAALADSIENKSTVIRDVPGPIGITGELSVLYVDDTLRISGGSQTPVFDDQGTVVVPGQFNLLFVLERPN